MRGQRTISAMCVTCMCGNTYMIGDGNHINCECGAHLKRQGSKVFAKVPGNYNWAGKQSRQPQYFKEKMPVNGVW